MISIITGNEPYLIDTEKRKVIVDMACPEMNYLRTGVFDKDTLLFLNTYPIADPRRVCFVDIDKQSILDTPEFLSYLKKPQTTSDVLILLREYDGRTKFGKFLKETGYLKILNKYDKEEDVKRFLFYEMKRNNIRMTENAFAEFMRLENYFESEDVNLLSMVSDLLSMSAIDKDITLQMVQTFVNGHVVADKFALAKLIKDKNVTTLMQQARVLSKDDLIGTLSLLLREYRLAWKSNFATLSGVRYMAFKGMSVADSLKGMSICLNAIDNIKAGIAVEDSLMAKVFLDLCGIGG